MQAGVHIDIGYRSTVNPRKTPSAELLEEFDVTFPPKGNDKGGTKIFRFYDDSGKPFRPKLPFMLHRNHPYFEKNLAAFKAYKETRRPQMQILDPQEEDNKELDLVDLKRQALNKVADLKKADQNDTLVNMLRRLEGSVGDITIREIVLRLNRIAEQDPSRILSLDSDPNFDTKVVIDKAIEAGRIALHDGRFFKYPDGRLIADGLEQMVFKMKSDLGVKSYVANTTTPTSVIPEEPASSVLTDLDSLRALGEDETKENTVSDSKPEISEDRMQKAIQAGIDMEYFTTDAAGAYKLEGGASFKELKDAVLWYSANPDKFISFETEMRSYGAAL